MFSKSQIDRLGERLKKGNDSDQDLKILTEYRASFRKAYDAVDSLLKEKLRLAPTGRPTKSTDSIVDKLRRESIRLSQIQDIAGCRVVVSNVIEQEGLIPLIKKEFARAHVDDRRLKSSYGYRAVHIIVQMYGMLLEIQVRTLLQHRWAELSEKLSDFDPGIKYGGGDPNFQNMLVRYSKLVEMVERYELIGSKLDAEGSKKLENAMGDMSILVAGIIEQALARLSK